jgi:hypothetical protein
MAAVALDMLVQFDAASRWFVLSAWILGSAVGLVILLVRPILYRRTVAGAARRLETIYPELGSDLINLVQLSRDEAVASQLLKEYALLQAASNAEAVALEAAPRRLSLRQRFRCCMHSRIDLACAVALLVLLALGGGVFHWSIAAWPNAVYRIFHPGQFVPAIGAAVIARVTPGRAETLSGDSLVVTAALENPDKTPFVGELVAIDASGAEARFPLTAAVDFDEYTFTFPKVSGPFGYRLEIGGTQTPIYSVDVFDRPEVRGITATYRYPAYTGLGEQTVELTGGSLEAPQFTTAELAIATTAPVKSATLVVNGKEQSARPVVGQPKVRGELVLLENGFYTVHLTDDRGNANADPPRSPIKVLIDAPPVVQLAKPGPEITAAPGETIAVEVHAGDDFGLSRIELRSQLEGADGSETPVQSWTKFSDPKSVKIRHAWKLPEKLASGSLLLYRVVARDNRQVRLEDRQIDPQESATALARIRIVDRAAHYAEKLQSLEQFRQELWRIYQRQTGVRVATTPLTVAAAMATAAKTAAEVHAAQREIKDATVRLADGISEAQQSLAPFRTTLKNLGDGRMTEAVAVAGETTAAGQVQELNQHASKLVGVQDDILDILRRLLDLARVETSKTIAQMENRPGGDLPNDAAGQLKNLSEKLKEFLKEQRKVIEASEDLAKKPVEDFTDDDKQLIKALAAAEDDWSKFLKDAHSDLSRLPEQDFSNPSMLQELIDVATEIKMASDALTQKAVEIAVPLEQLGAEMAQEMTTNIEKWLPDTPDRERWKQEEPLTDAMREAPMAELPFELEDIVGELMEDEEDLFDELEDVSSSWADSIDKGAGWDALDGPISNMSARGVTGNRLPNTSEIGGRSGEGRSGKSSGEFVGDSAVGKGGRKTPSRLTPDPFEKGQVKDTSKDPVGGATGGGKESGQGGEGLEGPLPPPLKRELERLAGKQATLRNRAEAIRLQFKIANYNTEKLDALLELMKRTERHLFSGHFRSALRRQDVMLEALGDVRRQTSEQTIVKTDASASVPQEIRKAILGSMSDPSPTGWEQLNKSYFERIASGK